MGSETNTENRLIRNEAVGYKGVQLVTISRPTAKSLHYLYFEGRELV